MHRQTATVRIPTMGGPLSIPELLLSISMLRGLYVASAGEISRLGYDVAESPSGELGFLLAEKVALRIEAKHSDIEALQTRLFEIGNEELPIDELGADLELMEISRSNPIDITVLGLALPLMVAVILSGGKFHLGPMKVELPPLGKGIQALRSALAPLPAPQIRAIASRAKKESKKEPIAVPRKQGDQ